jgi:hypothetical protein
MVPNLSFDFYTKEKEDKILKKNIEYKIPKLSNVIFKKIIKVKKMLFQAAWGGYLTYMISPSTRRVALQIHGPKCQLGYYYFCNSFFQSMLQRV